MGNLPNAGTAPKRRRSRCFAAMGSRIPRRYSASSMMSARHLQASGLREQAVPLRARRRRRGCRRSRRYPLMCVTGFATFTLGRRKPRSFFRAPGSREADDDDVDASSLACVVLPREALMREVDLHAEVEDGVPDGGHLRSLRDGVRGHEADCSLRVLDELGGLANPDRDVVQCTGGLEILPGNVALRLLRRRELPVVGRVATHDQVVVSLDDAAPVEDLQRCHEPCARCP